MIMRPSVARPAEGFGLKSLQRRFSGSALPQDAGSTLGPAKQPHSPGGSVLPSPEDDAVRYDLELLAEEENIAEILLHGFSNGASCLRVSLSPRGVLRESLIDDFNGLSLESYAQNPSLMARIKRKNTRGPMVITNED